MKLNRSILATAMFCATCHATVALGDVQDYWTFDEWTNAVGEFTTIDFTGHDQFTVITDQYSDLGVHFIDGNDFISNTGSYPNDGSGLHGSWADLQITIEFSEPQLWIGIDHPGSAGFDLYFQSELVHSMEFSQNGPGNFSGLVSATPFDSAVVWRTTGDPPNIDDLHYGIPTPGAVAVLALAGVLGTGSRRRRG